MKVEGGYYPHHNKQNLDLTDTNYIRYIIGNESYIDIRIKDGELQISGSHVIQITPSAGNAVNVKLKDTP